MMMFEQKLKDHLKKELGEDVVLEIGPGKGVLTNELSKYVKKVIAVEIDKSLSKSLVSLEKNVIVQFGNILELFDSLKFNKIVSNIPYSISEPLLKKIIKKDLDNVVLLIGQKFYYVLTSGLSKWSYIIKLFYEIKKVVDVPRECFKPRPRTDSIVISFTLRKKSLTRNEKVMKEFVLQSDKTVKNALINSFVKVYGLTKKQAKIKFESLKIPVLLHDKHVDVISNEEFNKFYIYWFF